MGMNFQIHIIVCCETIVSFKKKLEKVFLVTGYNIKVLECSIFEEIQKYEVTWNNKDICELLNKEFYTQQSV